MTATRGVIQPQTNSVPLRICLRGEDSDGGVRRGGDGAGFSQRSSAALHPTHGEGFYVLAGQLTVQIGKEIVSGGLRTWAFAPPDTRTPWPT